MRKIAMWISRGAAAAIVAALIAVIGVWVASEVILRRSFSPRAEAVRAAGPAAVEEGRRLSKLYGCTSCHGPELRGHLFNDEPALVRNFTPQSDVAHRALFR